MANMDVGTIANVSAGISQYMTQSKNVSNTNSTTGGTDTQDNTAGSSGVGDAYSVDISDAAREAAANAETKEAEETKGLSDDEIQYLKDSIQMNQQTMLNMMIQALTESNDKLKGWLDEGVGILNFDGVQIDAAKFGMPEVATNPEDAAKAVSDDGDWGVNAVATRIFDMASAIAGNDPEKLEKMRAAVEEGFSQAGVVWNNATGLDKMPEITNKTYDEIMSRFDKRAEELSGAAAATAVVS